MNSKIKRNVVGGINRSLSFFGVPRDWFLKLYSFGLTWANDPLLFGGTDRSQLVYATVQVRFN